MNEHPDTSSTKSEGAKEKENRLYQELQEAVAEETRLMAEIDKVLKSTPDRKEAEKIMLEQWAPLMDKALKKSSELSTQWLKSMEE